MGREARGFTIVEILISIVVISLALVGILALLTASTKVAGEVIEDSYAATLARSVYESLREGSRKRAFAVQDGPNLVRGFVFLHEGVKNDGFAAADVNNCTPPPLPTGQTDTSALAALRKSDFAIFLPKPIGTNTSGGTVEPYFVFPRPATSADDVATQNSTNKDNWLTTPAPGYLSSVYLDVQRVYQLRDRPAKANTTGVAQGPLEQQDQYGFAVVIRRAKAPPLKSDSIPQLSDGMIGVDGLYEVQVLVYRNFEKETTSRSHEPLPGGRFVELMSIGY